MKLRHLLPVAMLSLPMLSQAVPAYPGILSMANPDGSRVELRLMGDEAFSYLTDANGVNLYEKNSNGFWVKAVRDGAQLLNVPADIARLRSEQTDGEGDGSIIRSNLPSRFGRVGDDGRSLFPTTGQNLKFCVVLLEYKDTKFSMEDPQAFYTRWFNEENFTYNDLTHSARDYYIDSSKGAFKPTFVVSPVVSLPKMSSFYVGSNKYSNFALAIYYALSELEEKGFDLSQFDMDNDGKIDNVYFVYAGYGQADTGDATTIWPHKSDLSSANRSYCGKQFGPYATSNELRGSSHYTKKDGAIQGIGTFCHEFGHVLGLPDLYDPSYESATESQLPGDWTLMCNGPYLDDSRTPPTFSSYEKWLCRWLEYDEATPNTHYTLNPLANEAKAVRISVPKPGSTTPSNEYYLLENRTRTGFDKFLPADGLIIWHVDFDGDVWTANRVNATAGRPRCSLMTPKGEQIKNGYWPASNLYGTFIAPGYENSFKPFNTYNTDAFTPHVLNIRYDKDAQVASFDYRTSAELYNGVPKNVRAFLRPNNAKGFELYWDRAEGATDYSVSIIRYSTQDTNRQWPYTVDNYVDRLVGNVTSCSVTENLAMMAQPHVITIRAIGESFPSSEVYEFETVPNDLTGVAGVEAEGAEIFGENGRIVAPEGAQAFTLSGTRVALENLPAGIYMVRYGATTTKVVVK